MVMGALMNSLMKSEITVCSCSDLKRCSRAASLFDGRLCHVQLILTYSVSCVSLFDCMKLGIWNPAIGGFVAIHVYSMLEY